VRIRVFAFLKFLFQDFFLSLSNRVFCVEFILSRFVFKVCWFKFFEQVFYGDIVVCFVC
jgi:hypothetical protein